MIGSKRWSLYARLALAGLAAAAPGLAQGPPERPMSLRDCVLAALKHNLGVAVEVISPEIAGLSYRFAKEKYIPGLSLGVSSQNTSSASFSFIEAAAIITSQDKNYAGTLSGLLPTGGRLSMSLSSYKSESNRSFQTINPRYGSTLSFSLSQPLLRNFGLELNRRDIVIARNNLDISETQFRSVLQDTVYAVEQAYWGLVYAVENLRVRRQSLQLARDLLTKNTREADVGTIAPIEILNAEAEVATREADILEAESLVASGQDHLLLLMNIPETAESPAPESILPLDEPGSAPRPVRLEDCLATAMDNRPDLQVGRIDLRNKSVTYDYLRNQLLPDLSLTMSYWSPGLSGTQILYQDDNPLTGIVVGTVPGGAGASLRDAFRNIYRNWAVGLSLSVPINNYVSRAHAQQIQLSRDQAELRLRKLEQQILLEVKDAVRDVETDHKRIGAYRAARELAERKLQAEEKKLKVGLTTNYVVLWHQRDLADARSAELKAVIDYNLSLARLDRALGTSLKSKAIGTEDALRPQAP